MLFITFQVAGNRYALEARRIIEIVPRAALRPVAGAPGAIAGLLNYRGQCVPVVDLCRLLGGEACNRLLSSRLILTACRPRSGCERIVALLAERVTETIARDEAHFAQAGLLAGTAQRHGLLAAEGTGFIQRVQPETLLAGELESLLVGATEPGA